MTESVLAIVFFSGLVMALVFLILVARRSFLPRGSVSVLVNERRTLELLQGVKLLDALGSAGIYLPSACGGKGTCGQCRFRVLEDAPPAIATEAAILSEPDRAAGLRLACQFVVRTPLSIRVPEAIFGVRHWKGRVKSSRNVGTLIKEIVIDLPDGETIDFRAGSFVQVTAPPYTARFADFPIDDAARSEWDRLNLWRYVAASPIAVTRAYSLANFSDEDRIVMLLVRLATPPPLAAEGTPPGVVSSYLFQVEPGESVELAGPYGDFFATSGDAEMVFIGGGAGMAPMRSHLLDQLLKLGTERRISFWYGARSRRELFYEDLFDRLQAEHENFSWTPALSEPEEGWAGEVGFIHDVLHRRYLATHPNPRKCEYYLCGPPVMANATQSLLSSLGVPREQVHFDDFGA